MANTKWRLSHELLDNAPFRNLGYCNLHPAILKKLVDWKFLHSREREEALLFLSYKVEKAKTRKVSSCSYGVKQLLLANN